MCIKKTCIMSLAVIRAKVVGRKEIASGNDVYGNPIKRIQYDIKQTKVRVCVCVFAGVNVQM